MLRQKRESEYEEALNNIQRGDKRGKTKLAWLMLSGDDRDEDKAVVMLEERTKERDAEAMWMLGLCCEFGIGTEQELERARSLYQQSSTKKNPVGMYLAQCNSFERRNGILHIYCLRN